MKNASIPQELNDALLVILNMIQAKDQRINELEEENEILHNKIRNLIEEKEAMMNKQSDTLTRKPSIVDLLDESKQSSSFLIKSTPPNKNQSDPIAIHPREQTGPKGKGNMSHHPDSTKEINFNFNNHSTNIINHVISSGDSKSQRTEIKNFLSEVKEVIPLKDFKDFIKCIKLLTDKSQDRKEIFNQVKNIFGLNYPYLYCRFEEIISQR